MPDFVAEELHKLGISLNEEEELRQIKSVDENDPELNKELEKLLSKSINDSFDITSDKYDLESKAPLDDENVEEDLTEMFSGLGIQETEPSDVQKQTISPSPIKRNLTSHPSIADTLKQQIEKCNRAIEFYNQKGLSDKRILFERRRDAMIKDLEKGEDFYGEYVKKQKKLINVKVNYEIKAPTNDFIVDEEIVITCVDTEGLLKSGNKRLEIALEFYSDLQVDQFSSSINQMHFRIKRNDVRTVKFFEHRRLRIRLLEEYSYWIIFTGFKTIESSSVKLDQLLRENSCTHHIKIGGKGVSIKMDLRRPILAALTGNYLKRSEIWQIPLTDRSAGLYTEIPRREATKSNNNNVIELIPVEEIKSYNGLEHEIDLISKGNSKDSSLNDRLFLLEAQRDMLNLQVQLGSLQPDQYRILLERERTVMKNKAVEWRDKGSNKGLAKQYLKHMKLIEQELAEMKGEN